MDHVERLLTAYERGALSRRQYLSAMAAVIFTSESHDAAAQTPQARPLGRRSRLINHIGLEISSIPRTTEFYQKLGVGDLREVIPGALYENGVFKGPTEKRYGLDVGPGAVLTLGETKDPKRLGRISHFCIGIEGFNYKRDMDTLRKAGLKVLDNDEAQTAFSVMDPDGIHVQVSDMKEMYACPNKVGHKLC